MLPLCHIAFYFLSVVRTNYLSIFEQGKVKPSASSPLTTPENKHFSFNNIFKIFVTFSSAFVKVLNFCNYAINVVMKKNRER